MLRPENLGLICFFTGCWTWGSYFPSEPLTPPLCDRGPFSPVRHSAKNSQGCFDGGPTLRPEWVWVCDQLRPHPRQAESIHSSGTHRHPPALRAVWPGQGGQHSC